MNLIERLEAVLMEAQLHRKERMKLIGNEASWVIYERDVMLAAVNAECALLGKPPVKNVDKAEQAAIGHWDYTHKFAIGCAETVVV